MTDERIGAETLAAFLDGKLDPMERSKVLRILAEHPEEYEAFSEAAHAAAALADSGVLPIDARKRRARRWVVAIPALIAAGIAAVVVVPRLGGGDALSPAHLAGRLKLAAVAGNGSLAMKLGENWDQPGWSITRGAGPELAEPARAFRLGARATDVAIALRARDTTALRLVGDELVGLLGGMDAGGPAAALYRNILASGASTSARSQKEAGEALRILVGDSPWYELGAWSEAARVALLAGQPEFIADRRAQLANLITRLEARPAGEGVEVVRLLKGLQTNPDTSVLRQIIAAAGR